MLESYTNCPIRAKAGGDQVGRPKKINTEEKIVETEEIFEVENITEIEKPKVQKPKLKKQICNVLYKTDKKFAIDFNGGGISFKDNLQSKTDKVEITYLGEYATENFKIESYRFI